MAGSLSTAQRTALNQDTRQFLAQYSGGLPEYIGYLEDLIKQSSVGALSTAAEIDAACDNVGLPLIDANTTYAGGPLTFAWGAGRLHNGLVDVTVASGSLALTSSSTNYVELDPITGAVSRNTSGWTRGRVRLYTVVCGSSTITSIAAARSAILAFGAAGIPGELLSAPGKTKELLIPLGTVNATSSFRLITPPAGCTITAVRLVVGTTVTTSDTNYWTLSVQNKGAAGTGTTDALAVSDANTTKATGGSGLTANVARQFNLHGTAGNLATAASDVLLATFTKTAAAADLVGASLAVELSFQG